ncbi:AIM1 protein [Artemisia annua]|uniref:AIM1 protein n=1 Tax=Artemisia annua TaxID=35608 RepID=A0A2U1NQZ5_ARTAN|nr:AIM1 protein [Artemisia annua]
MVLFPVVNVAGRVLEEGSVVRASDLDIASVLGMSFPSHRYTRTLAHRLVVSEAAKGHLINFFFSQHATSKVANVTDVGLKSRAIKKGVVIGEGFMGSGDILRIYAF